MSNRLASVLLAACALLTIAAISMHPAVHARHAADVLRGAVAIGPMDRAIHTSVLLMAFAMLFSLTTYTMGRLRSATVAALAAYALGCGAIFVAALIDGFFVPSFAQSSIGASGAAQGAAITVLVAGAVTIQIATKFALIAMSAAMVLWSVDLLAQREMLARIAGVVGIVAGIVVCVLSFVAGSLNPHSLTAVVGVQALWYLAIARILYVLGEAGV